MTARNFWLLVTPILGWISFLFLVRIIAATFSSKSRELIRKNPVRHLFWGGFAFLYFIGIQLLLGGYWPPPSVERRTQRRIVLDRIQSIGGWETLRRECLSLMRQHEEDHFYWWSRGRDTNALPASILALKPMSVEYDPTVQALRIRIFGMHSTGGHDTPCFGLEVATGPERKDYKPRPMNAVGGNRHMNYQKVAEDIYEVY